MNDQKMWNAIAESKNEKMHCPLSLERSGALLGGSDIRGTLLPLLLRECYHMEVLFLGVPPQFFVNPPK